MLALKTIPAQVDRRLGWEVSKQQMAYRGLTLAAVHELFGSLAQSQKTIAYLGIGCIGVGAAKPLKEQDARSRARCYRIRVVSRRATHARLLIS